MGRWNPSRAGILTAITRYTSTGVVCQGGKISQVTDGLSNTVMIGERPPGPGFYGQWAWFGLDVRIGAQETTLAYPLSGGGWGWQNGTWGPLGTTCPSPAYFGPGDNTNFCSSNHFWSWHTGGGNFAFGDGSVRFLPYSANQILIPLSTRAGGEVVDASQY